MWIKYFRKVKNLPSSLNGEYLGEAHLHAASIVLSLSHPDVKACFLRGQIMLGLGHLAVKGGLLVSSIVFSLGHLVVKGGLLISAVTG